MFTKLFHSRTKVLQEILVLCQTLIFECGTLRAPAWGVVFCPSYHALRTPERPTRHRRLTPILSFDKALVMIATNPSNAASSGTESVAQTKSQKCWSIILLEYSRY
jgi:hypothetical protein